MLLEKKRSYFITDDIEICSDDSFDSDDPDEKTQMKTIKYINVFLKGTRIILSIYFLKANKKEIIIFLSLGL